ncbi:semaphorin-7A-like isoform X1 [Conger conger]|uniref:semaphorin-7A-like isoform X1 n=2 Tax=Conger conger TaxID=82655 RepID=UPI002A5A90DE|nr:semaphorin-7A-like isoform X1 [Conger conger]
MEFMFERSGIFQFGMSVSQCLLFLNIFLPFSVASANDNPRVVLAERDVPIKRYSLHVNNSRIELLEGFHDNRIFVGGHGRIWYIDFDGNKTKEVKFPVLERKGSRKSKRSYSKPAAACNYEYDVTTLHSIDATLLLVCASNGQDPKCCCMSTKELKCSEDWKASGIAPLNVTEQAPSLYLEGDVYAAVNVGNSLAIRRIGRRNSIWPDIDKKEQRYVSMAFSGPREDPLQDRVYTFLLQKSSNEDMDASPWTSWVTQVCKADLGGSKAFLQQAWTSRLSARLSCGIRDGKLFFNQLLDVTVLRGANWKESRVYGLFKNRWGKTAVCVYTMADIDHVFKTSDFKGFTGTVPEPRPGEQCVRDSTTLPTNVLKHIKENPDMKDWVWPVQGSGPLMVSDNHYRHIRVDRVEGAGHGQRKRNYTVLFLSLDSGSVHKVLEHAGGSFIIAELQLFSNRSSIQKLLLPLSSRKLYVSSSREVVEVDLQGCQRYGPQCEDCVLARDPYCSWDGTHCTGTGTDKTRIQIQDVEHGNHFLCRREGGEMAESYPLQVSSGASAMPVRSDDVPLPSYYILKCPMSSSHAYYFWLHDGIHRECLLSEGSCLLPVVSGKPDQEGSYECKSTEGGYVRTLARYQLSKESRVPGLTPSLPALACLLLSLALIL